MFDDGGDPRRASQSAASRARTLLAQATDTVEGFAIVLCDLKTLLETGESREPGARQGGAHHRGRQAGG